MSVKMLVSIVIMFLCSISIKAQEDINSLVSFAKAYGFVKYFHPSSEAANIDWNKFSAYGAQEVLKCQDKSDLLNTLNQLFKPLGPAIRFSYDLEKFNLNDITPENIEDYKLSYWQHLGVSKGMQYKYPDNAFNSVLINQILQVDDTTQIIAEPIFEAVPKFGELVEEEIGDKLYCQIPLSLYVNEQGTYPKSQSLGKMQASLDNTTIASNSLAVRIGNVINMYNVFQHFYPYFEEVDVNWNEELEIALERCFKDRNAEDHLITLEKFTSTLRDGHLWIWQGKSPYKYYPDIQWEWIQDSLVITEVLDENLNIDVGDIVCKVNNQTAKEYFKEVNSRIPYGTKTYLNYANTFRSLSKEEGTDLVLEINNIEHKLKHTRKVSEYKFKPIKIQEQNYLKLDGDIMYINLGSISTDTLTSLMPQLIDMKGIIGDFRGHNYRVWDFLAHFSKEEIPDGWATKIPKIIYPNQERIIADKETQGSYEVKKPYLGDIKTVFLVDGRTKSSSESFISTVKLSNLGTIIGEQTAGANGNINPFKLLGDYTIWWTGMKVTNPDGSPFHCIGITPDVVVEKTIEGIKNGKDEFLNKAIEFLNK